MQALNLKTNQVEELDSEQLEMALLNRTHTVRGSDVFDVVRPDGKISKIQGSSIFNALEEGYKLPNRDLHNAIIEEDEYESKDPQAFGLGLLRSLMFIGGDKILSEGFGIDKTEIEKIKRYNPYWSAAGEVAGLVGPALATGGTGLIGRAASLTPVGALTKGSLALENMVGRALLPKSTLKSIEAGTISSPLIKTGAEMTAKAIGTAVEGSAYGASNYISEQYLGDTPFSAEALFSNMKEEFVTGGIIGALIPPVAKVGKKLVRAVTEPAGTEFQAFLGADPMSSRYYLMNPEFFEKAKNPEELGDMIFDRYKELENALNEGRINYNNVDEALKQAKAEFKDYPSVVKERIKEIDNQFEKVIANEKLKQASLGIDEDVAEEFQQYKNLLKQKFVESSDYAYELLDEADAVGVPRLSYKNLLSALDRYTKPYFKKGLKKGELATITRPDKAALQIIKEVQEDLKKFQGIQKGKFGDDLASFTDLKFLLKKLDEATTYGTRSEFSTKTSDAILKRFRRYIDDVLKTRVVYPSVSDDYFTRMIDAKDKRDLLEILNDQMGDRNAIMSQLEKAAHGKPRNLTKYILDLGGHTDTYDRITSMLDDMSRKAKFVSGKDLPLEREILKQLPENQELGVLLQDQQILNKIKNLQGSDLSLRDYFDKIVNSGITVEKSPALRKLLERINLSDERFKSATALLNTEKELKTLKPFATKEEAVSKVQKSLSKSFNDIKIIFNDVSKLTDPELTSLVQQLKVREAFNKRPNTPGGFRNAGFFGALTGLLAYPFAGATGAGITFAMGGVIGGLVDYYGPSIARKILKKASKIKGIIEPHHIQKMMMEEFGEGPNKYILEMNSEALKEIGKTRKEQSRRLIEASRAILDPSTIIKVKSTTDDDELSYQSAKDNADKIIANANNLEAGVFNDNEVVSLIMPETYANYVDTYVRMANFLQSKIPADADNQIDEYVPSRSEEFKFRKYYKYATNPAKALDSIMNGDISPMAIETLRDVYPTTFNYLNELVVEHLSEVDLRTIPRPVKQKIKEYFGINLLPNLNSSLFMKMQTPNVQTEQQMAERPKKMKNYSGQMKTEMDRITNRA